MPSSVQPFIWGSALWALALVAVLLGVEPFGLDRATALGTCIAALILGTLGFVYLWPRHEAAPPQE